jgi:hypothetical protein
VADGPEAVILLSPDKDGTEAAFGRMIVFFCKIIIEDGFIIDGNMLEF